MCFWVSNKKLSRDFKQTSCFLNNSFIEPLLCNTEAELWMRVFHRDLLLILQIPAGLKVVWVDAKGSRTIPLPPRFQIRMSVAQKRDFQKGN